MNIKIHGYVDYQSGVAGELDPRFVSINSVTVACYGTNNVLLPRYAAKLADDGTGGQVV